MGDAPPSNVNTLGGQLQLQEQGNKRLNLKKTDRKAGFERLFKLIDFTALEFYDDDRVIYIGAKSKSEEPVNFVYNSDLMKVNDYYPTVDVQIHVGNGIQNSKALTIQALSELSKMTITPQNYKFVKAYIDEINIPQRVELNKFIDELMQPQPPTPGVNPQGVSMQQILEQGGFSPEELDILEKNPELAHQAAQQNGLNIV
jgi:hypothetical protein